MTGGMTSVLVADGRQMVAETLERVIDAEPDMSVVCALTAYADLFEHVERNAPDVLVLGCDFGGDGLTVARRLRDEQPATRVVMLIDDATGTTSARAAIVAGCLGVISKDRGAEDLCNAIRSAARGRAVAAVSDLDGLFGAPPLDDEARRGGLTGRQYEVLQLMAEGCATDDVAARLYVSRNTVRTHVQHVFRKLGARSRLEAVAIARRNGVLG